MCLIFVSVKIFRKFGDKKSVIVAFIIIIIITFWLPDTLRLLGRVHKKVELEFRVWGLRNVAHQEYLTRIALNFTPRGKKTKQQKGFIFLYTAYINIMYKYYHSTPVQCKFQEKPHTLFSGRVMRTCYAKIFSMTAPGAVEPRCS